jgi:hypothetical protein
MLRTGENTMSVMTLPQPNSTAAIRERMASQRLSPTWPLLIMLSRLILFALFQALIAGVFALQNHAAPWDASTGWWLVSATLTNGVSIALLAALTRREGLRLRELYNATRATWKRDLLISLALLVLCAPVMLIPNILVGNLLFGDVTKTMGLMFRPLPSVVILVIAVLFPLTIAFAELPTYFGYVRPRLEAWLSQAPGQRAWLSVALPIFFLAAQHCALPLIFDVRFILWRLLMFLPFAALVGLALRWRPSLLPYMMAIHALLDLQTVLMVPAA